MEVTSVDQRTRVLFLCTGNSCRSQMAEALLRHHGGSRFVVHSAGTNPKPIHPKVAPVLEEVGIQINGQTSKGLEEFLGKRQLDHVIIVCDKAKASCPRIWPGLINAPIYWPFEDPAAFVGDEAAIMDKFRQVRDEIEESIVAWVKTVRDY